jgi:hypothetical protein
VTGDTVALYLRWMLGTHPHIRVLGPMGGINRSMRTKLWGMHRIEIQNKSQIFSGAEDFCTKGSNGTIEDLTWEKLYETPSAVCWQHKWRFIKRMLSINDTLDIVRRVLMRRGEAYFLVDYEFTWVDAQPDSVRFLWHFQRQLRFGKQRSRHDVGFAPGYGIVTRRHRFDAQELEYLAGMLNIGNPLAAYEDTLPDGSSSHMAPALKADLGSGVPSFPGGFIRFNPGNDICPFEFAWIDTPGTFVETLHSDSLRIRVDTTNVLDGVSRFLYARSLMIPFRQGQTRRMEYAIGRAVLVDDGFPPEIPDIVWSDGTPAGRVPRQ